MSGTYARGALGTVLNGIAPVEAMGQSPFEVAGGAGQTSYAGVLGVAPRTLVRMAQVIANVASTAVAFFVARGITGHTVIANYLTPINTATDAQAQCIGGPSTAVLGGTIGKIFNGVSLLGVGGAILLFSNTSGLAIDLFPGDAFYVTGTVAAGVAQTMFWGAIAEFPS